MLNRFVSSSITEYLTDEEKTDLRIAYRGNRRDFTDSDAVKSLNSKLQTDYSFNNKVLSLNLRENEIDSWKNEMSLSLDEIPFENTGFGTQNMVKSEMFLQQNSDVDILIIEEPENNLSLQICLFLFPTCQTMQISSCLYLRIVVSWQTDSA